MSRRNLLPLAVVGLVFVLAVGAVYLATLGDYDNAGESNTTPTISRSYDSCEDARIEFDASVQAKDNFDEGTEQRQFHNDQVVKAGNYLNDHCGGA